METGRLAKLANGSVLVTYGESVVLVTATMSKPREGIDFFPLTVDFGTASTPGARSPEASSAGRDGPAPTPS